MTYLFTSESVSEGHPDKIADQISDAILDAMLTQDPKSRVACETMVTTGLAVIAGEVTTKAYVEIPDVVRDTINKIGYDKEDYSFAAHSCGVQVALHSQSPDIAQGVNVGEGVDKEQGAGDQGMMFGYATKETEEYMPMALAFSHSLVKRLAEIRKNHTDLIGYLRPDAKAQVTIEYNEDNTPKRVHTIVVSTQHDEFPGVSDDVALGQIATDIKEHVINKVIPAELIDADTIFHINPTGKFVIGGPHGDAGLTGRKIIVDTYGGKGAHGGGAFSGKDPSKVDRSAAYASRHIAKNLVAAGVADEALVQVAYAIGVSEPVSLNVTTYGTSKVDMTDAEISKEIEKIFDMRPSAIVKRLGLTNPIFLPTAAYGHMGQAPYTKEVEINSTEVSENNGKKVSTTVTEKKEVEFFTWEKLDYVDKIKSAFKI
ncbi:methionine adenosyltransferase [Flammeovirga kamogawensis]|uniref:S-adenosylmethionine synthase n=1 Tax=Flammeovirga kamogawensis TaxID=373891 RepID=A0ABX8GZ63_9BACT|nr:methionine adenosyltransferase [Flammeovirga kamogawensis]MBB6459348.1 S-adenosylmethionine synthetase [Flammeovirga kamogawensis]QWG08905.1 methionine adenosyltransferase [Flammeovirga kamogawensis]TRX67196.1 methionine adenosyltransferase [Flammeovirga kamogawensis]